LFVLFCFVFSNGESCVVLRSTWFELVVLVVLELELGVLIVAANVDLGVSCWCGVVRSKEAVHVFCLKFRGLCGFHVLRGESQLSTQVGDTSLSALDLFTDLRAVDRQNRRTHTHVEGRDDKIMQRYVYGYLPGTGIEGCTGDRRRRAVAK